MLIFDNDKYPITKGKYPMQDPCRNGLVSDGRKKSRLIKEKNARKYPMQEGKYPMQKGKYPMKKPCRKGLVSDGSKKFWLMEEKYPS